MNTSPAASGNARPAKTPRYPKLRAEIATQKSITILSAFRILSYNTRPEDRYRTKAKIEKEENNPVTQSNQRVASRECGDWPVQTYTMELPKTARKTSGRKVNPSVTLNAFAISRCIFSVEPKL